MPSLAQTGFTFGGWNKAAGEEITSDVKLTASWTPEENPPEENPDLTAAYTVEHYKQNIADNNYTRVTADTENKTGTAGANTSASAKTYTGFTAKTFDQLKIAADGSTVVKIYYDRNTYTVSYSSTYGTAPDSKTVKYGYTLTSSDLPTLTQAGYVFGGWNKSAGDEITAAVTVTASWTPATNTAYKVEHYQQNVADNNYTLVSADTENKTGTTLADTAAVSKTYTGFTAKSFAQTKIAADGSTVVKIYYDRNTYTVSYSSTYGTAPESKTVRYGYALTASDLPSLTQTGYVFGGWNKSAGDEITAASTITASWTPATNTAYKVEHYQQNVADNSYTLVSADTENKTGTTLTDTSAVSKTYAGFTAKSFEQKSIAADGSTVVKIYYDRNTVTVSYSSTYGTAPDSKTVKYGYSLTSVDLPDLTQTGYVFGSWNKSVGDTITAAVTVTASWTPATNTAYKVEHYQQNIADNNYTLVSADTENKTGTTDSDTAAASKTYTGFTAKSFEQKSIAPDGTTVVKIYYDRNLYTISFNSDGGTTVFPIEAKYGAAVTAPSNPARDGYVFTGWTPSVPQTMPASDTELTAVWEKIDASFDITLSSTNAIEMTFSANKDASKNLESFSFTVPDEYETYNWYLDGDLESGYEDNQCTIPVSSLSDATHEILVIVIDSDGIYNSARATFVYESTASNE